ncbi:MAG: hypothetical protein ABH858_00315, partial [Candidatus Omnitrophota bacterium]
MRRKDNLLVQSFILTYLLISIQFALSYEAFGKNFVFINIILSLSGFVLNWFMREKKEKVRQIVVDISSLTAFLFIAYWIVRSSFLFEEMILSLIKGALIIETALSFNSYSRRNFAYIQIISLLIFFAGPLFVATDNFLNVLLLTAYLFIFILILKFRSEQGYKKPFSRPLPVCVFCFIIFSASLAISFIVKRNVIFPEVRYVKPFLLETERFEAENRRNQLSESIQDIFDPSKAESFKEKKDLVRSLVILLKQSADPVEIEQAYVMLADFLDQQGYPVIPSLEGVPSDDGLIDPLKRPGAGIKPPEDKQSGLSLGKGLKKQSPQVILKDYINTAISANSRNFRSDFVRKVTRQGLNLQSKVASLFMLNRIKGAKDLRTLDREINSLAREIDKANINNNLKRDLMLSLQELRKWEAYSIYNYTRNKLKVRSEKSNKELRQLTVSDIHKLQRQIKKTVKDIDEITGLLDKAIKEAPLTKTAESRLKEETKQFQAWLTKNVDYLLGDIKEAAVLLDPAAALKKTQSIKQDLAGRIKDIHKTIEDSLLSDRAQGTLEEELRKAKDLLSGSIETVISQIKETAKDKDLSKYFDSLAKIDDDLSDALDSINRGVDESGLDDEAKASLKEKIKDIADAFREDVESVLEGIQTAVNQEDFNNIHSKIEKLQQDVSGALDDFLEDVEKASSDKETIERLKKEAGQLKSDMGKALDMVGRKIGQPKELLSEFRDQIERAMSGLELSELHKDISDLEKYLENIDYHRKDSASGALKNMTEAKMELVLNDQIDRLILEPAGQAYLKSGRQDLTFMLKSLFSSQTTDDFLKRSEELGEYLKSNFIDRDIFNDEQWEEMVNSKLKVLRNKEKEAVEKLLQEGVLTDVSKREFVKLAGDVLSEKDVSAALRQMNGKIEKFSQQGFISEETAKELSRRSDNLARLHTAKMFLESLSEEKNEGEQYDYYRKVKESIGRSASGREDVKRAVEELLEKLVAADSLKETSLIKNKIDSILGDIAIDSSEVPPEGDKDGLADDSRFKSGPLLEKISSLSKKNKDVLSKLLSEIQDDLQKEIEAMREDIAQAAKQSEEYKVNSKLEGLKDKIRKEIGNIEQFMGDLTKTEREILSEIVGEIQDKLERYVDDRKEDLSRAVKQGDESEATRQMEELKDAVKEAMKEAGKLSKAEKDDISGLLSEVKDELSGKIDSMKGELSKAVKQGDDAEARRQMEELKDAVSDAVKEAMKEAGKLSKAEKDDISGLLSEVKDELSG